MNPELVLEVWVKVTNRDGTLWQLKNTTKK